LKAVPTLQKLKTEPSREGVKQPYLETLTAGVVPVPGTEALVPEEVIV